MLEDAVKAMDNAAALLLCLTQDFVDDRTCRCLVTMAQKLNVPIIPVLMADNAVVGWVAEVVALK